MSLITKTNQRQRATEDIRCYKVFQKLENCQWKTFPIGYEVKPNVLMQLEPFTPKEKSCMLCKIKNLPRGMPKSIKGCYEVTRGAIHVCTDIAILRENIKDLVLKDEKKMKNITLEIWEVIIPKDAWYFSDITGESYAAEKIKLCKVV